LWTTLASVTRRIVVFLETRRQQLDDVEVLPLEDFLSELPGQPRQGCEVFMPFKSQAQRRKFAQLLVEGKISNETFEEWNRETGAKRLPERARRKTKSAKKSTGKKSPLKRTRPRSATRAHKR
jgi:hypothetical protein